WLWRLRPVWGLTWMLVLVLPWFIAIFWRAGDAFFVDSIGGDMLSKLGAQDLLAWLVPSWIVFELALTKLPHYVLPLYPAIAILTAGALERRVLSRSWLMRGAAWWFAIPAVISIVVVIGAIKLTRQPVFLAWPFLAAAMIAGLIAWWMFED